MSSVVAEMTSGRVTRMTCPGDFSWLGNQTHNSLCHLFLLKLINRNCPFRHLEMSKEIPVSTTELSGR